ncbi:MAG: class I SAM-dependent methyltransferase [Parachlamydiaceae bacterium]|nr:class I SAM-dependent methyltransferase [Parachlamydiaceae bacterium]
MSNNRLNVTYTDNKQQNTRPLSNARAQKEEIQATMERLWLQNPQQFDPLRDCIERKRIVATLEAIQSVTTLNEKKVVDLGCGAGILSRKMRDAGAIVDAVDIASQALQKLKSEDMQNITAIQDCLPSTSLHDQSYDLVICTELIGYLKSADYRMFIAELARLVKNGGFVVCSSDLDINTDNPLERLVALVETEFTVEKWILSYHLLQIRVCRFFEAPAFYVKCYQDKEYFQKEIEKRKGLRRRLFMWNTKMPLNLLWRTLRMVFNPFASLFRQNVWIMNFLEKITRFFWSEAGISHALFIGKRRPLTFPVKKENTPRELKHKRQVWE